MVSVDLHRASATGNRVTGKIGNAVKLCGNNEYIQVPNGIVSGLHDFTVSAWVNPSANSGWSRVFDFGTGTGNYMFLTLSAGGGPIRFAITTSGGGGEQQINGTSTLPLNTWSLVTVTLSGTTGTLYVNGQAVATNPSMTLNPAALGNTTQDYIGKSQYNDPYLTGEIDDFNIYSAALTASQVAALAACEAERRRRGGLQVRRGLGALPLLTRPATGTTPLSSRTRPGPPRWTRTRSSCRPAGPGRRCRRTAPGRSSHPAADRPFNNKNNNKIVSLIISYAIQKNYAPISRTVSSNSARGPGPGKTASSCTPIPSSSGFEGIYTSVTGRCSGLSGLLS